MPSRMKREVLVRDSRRASTRLASVLRSTEVGATTREGAMNNIFYVIGVVVVVLVILGYFGLR
jgi:small-conductance mechanosensitive channel